MSAGFIPPHGGYRDLVSFQKAEIVYDLTVGFCDRFLDRRDRTRDQMIQAARSGKQNIAEASMASGTSKETEVKLMNVARASLEELLNDYLDFLRVRGLRLWGKDSREALFVRRLSRGEPSAEPSAAPSAHGAHGTHGAHEPPAAPAAPPVTYEAFRPFAETRPPEVVANIAICLVHQANYLLDRLIARLEEDFVRHGGLRERMTRARLDYRAGRQARP